MKSRLSLLFSFLLAEYKAQGVSSDRLATVTENMIRKDANSAPKLKAKGAETRKLVPMLMAICHKILDPAVEVEAAALNCLSYLQQAYSALDLEPYSPTIMEDAARKLALQYVALGAFYNDGIAWRVKPKMHLLMHLSASQTCPKELWCYRDEDFGGAAAAMVRAKGGWNTPASSALNVLDKFRAKNDMPIIT